LKILYLIPHAIFPANNGNKQLITNLLPHISKEYTCDLIILISKNDNSSDLLTEINCKLPFVRNIIFFEKPSGINRFFLRIRALMFGYPLSFGDHYSGELCSYMQSANIKEYDVCHFDMMYMAQYKKFVQSIPSLLVPSDAYSMSVLMVQKVVNSLTENIKYSCYFYLFRRMERKLYCKFDMVCPVSQVDTDYLLKFVKKTNFNTIGLAIDQTLLELNTEQKSDRQSGNILFMGAVSEIGVATNIVEFILNVFNMIIVKIPKTKFYIVGRNPHPILRQALNAYSNIIHIDFIENYIDFFNEDWVYVSPLKVSVGVQTKIQQAMTLAIPVVAYEHSFIGVGVVDKTCCRSCKNAKEIFSGTLEFLSDPFLRKSTGEAARAKVVSVNSGKAISSMYVSAYNYIRSNRNKK